MQRTHQGKHSTTTTLYPCLCRKWLLKLFLLLASYVAVAVAVSTQRELQKIRRRSERRRQEPDGRFDASQGFASLTLRVVGVVVVVVVIKQLV